MKIAELSVNQQVTIPLVVKSATGRKTKAGKDYLSLTLSDGTDDINGNYWDWTSGKIPAPNSILDITAQVTEWQSAKQLNINKIMNNTTNSIEEFMPQSGQDVVKCYNDAYELALSIENDFLRDLTLAILDQLKLEWLTIPGAVFVHHDYIGGTLIHSYSTAKIATAMADNIPESNRDLVIAGALLHDVGKLFTYQIEGLVISMTTEGQLYDHLFIGAEFVGNFAEMVNNPDEYLLAMLRHIILSHHGKREYGAIVSPASIEAHIVSAADLVDSAVEQIRVSSNKAPAHSIWTDKIWALDNKPHINYKHS